MSREVQKINYKKSKVFWDARAEKFGRDNFLLATTLQDDLPAISDYRDIAEKKHLFRVVKFNKNMDILDLGGGTGRWAIELAKYARSVTLVDLSKSLLEIAKQQAKIEGFSNIKFVESNLLDFKSDKTFDIILISGVLMYINDEDLNIIVNKCFCMLKSKGKLILREGVNLNKKVVQIDEYSDELGCNYSVIWRKPQDYIDVFGRRFDLIYTKDAFPYLIPVFVYKRIVPSKYKKNKNLQFILRKMLMWQSKIDIFLLNFNLGMDLYHWWLKRKTLGVNAQFYVFKNDDEGERNFHFAGKDVVEMARNRETPFYLISESIMRRNYESFMSEFSLTFKPKVYYSVKTNYESGVLKYVKKMGIGAEIGSYLDLSLAERTGFPSSGMVLDGLFKETKLIDKAIKIGVGVINVECEEELSRINTIASRYKKIVNVGIRLNIDRLWGDWRNLIVDRNKKCFGMGINSAIKVIDSIKKYSSINVFSLMVHTSKSFTVPYDYSFILKNMFKAADIFRKKGVIIKEFNLGGGFPQDFSSKYSLSDFSKHISEAYISQSKLYGLFPLLSFELGKALVGDSAILVGKVCDVRGDSLIVDISHSDYGYVFPLKTRRVLIANKWLWSANSCYKMWSSTLEKFDILIKGKIKLPYVNKKDTVILFDVGAYSLPLSNRFIKPRCAVYFVTQEGKDILVRDKETAQDVVSSYNWDFNI